jgi:Fe/S biogenesis protein NfuA
MSDTSTVGQQLVSISDKAMQEILGHLRADGRPDLAARLVVTGRSSSGFQYNFLFIELHDRANDDIVCEFGDLLLHVDPASAEALKGSRIDFITDQWGGPRFQVDNPNPIWTDPIAIQVQELIDTQINPSIASHGGYIELLDVRGDTAYIKMGGGCQGCGMADVTLKQGIEAAIVDMIGPIQHVIDTTDHANGTNPYYAPRQGHHH